MSSSASWRVLRAPPLRRYLASRFASATATTLVRSTVAWQVFSLTQSKLMLGLIGLMAVPGLLVSPWAGLAADAGHRQRIVVLSQAAGALVCLGMAALTQGGLGVGWLFAAVALHLVAFAFENPSRLALLPATVPADEYGAAVVVQSTVQNLAWVSGPVVGGFLIGRFGVTACYLLAAGLVAASMLGFRGLRPARHRIASRMDGRSFHEALTYLRARPVILASMALDFFAVVFASVTALLPFFAQEVLAVGPGGYGLLCAALELGTVAMALLVMLLPPILRPGRALLWAVAGFGAATVVFGVSTSFWLSFLALALAGMADQISMVTRGSILHLSTPPALHGRVLSVNQMFIGASNHLGAVESGVLAELTSASFSVIFGGLASIAFAAGVSLLLPAMREYRPRVPLDPSEGE